MDIAAPQVGHVKDVTEREELVDPVGPLLRKLQVLDSCSRQQTPLRDHHLCSNEHAFVAHGYRAVICYRFVTQTMRSRPPNCRSLLDLP